MYTNNNAQQSQADIWQQPHQVKIIRWTKARSNRDGNGTNRGIEVQSLITNETRWVSLWSGHYLFKLANWGSTVHYNPNVEPHERLQLNANVQQANVQPNQSQADYYSRKAAEAQPQQSIYEQVEQGLYSPQNQQSEIDYSNQSNLQQSPQQVQPSNTIAQSAGASSIDIDERLLESVSLVISNAVNLAQALNPQLSEESVVKLAISASIAYQKIKADSPF